MVVIGRRVGDGDVEGVTVEAEWRDDILVQVIQLSRVAPIVLRLSVGEVDFKDIEVDLVDDARVVLDGSVLVDVEDAVEEEACVVQECLAHGHAHKLVLVGQE